MKNSITKESECQCCGIDLHALLGKAVAESRECPCCHFVPRETTSASGHRSIWMHDGMPWRSSDIKRPPGWDPQQRMAQMALATSLSKVKGRPPRLSLKYS